MKKFKITVVGAGAAGYFTAAALKKNFPEIEVQIVYDPKLKHLGVGESLGWNGRAFMRDILGLKDEHAWMKDSGSTYKFAVRHSGFDGTNNPYFFSWPFNGAISTLEKSILESKYGDISYPDKNSLYDIWAWLHLKGKKDKHSLKGDLEEYHYYAKYSTVPFTDSTHYTSEHIGYSYHINADRIRHTVHEFVGKPAGVVEIPVPIKDVVTNPDGESISHLVLQNDECIYSDLFIDCTGFSRLLVKKLPFVFEPCDEYFNNASIVGSNFYKDYTEHDSWTQLIAMPYGWRFQISLNNRCGNGYQYNRNIFSDEDQLIDQFEKDSGKKDAISKRITWEPGYMRDAFVGNCIVLGIGQGFADVFDANNFSGTLKFIHRLVDHFKADPDKTLDWKSSFNYFVHNVSEDIKFRIQCGLHLAPRNDTEYWKLMKEAAVKFKTLDRLKENIFAESRKVYQGFENLFWVQQTFLNTALYYNIPFDDVVDFSFTKQQEDLALNFFEFFNNKNNILAKNAEPLGDYYKRTVFKDMLFKVS